MPRCRRPSAFHGISRRVSARVDRHHGRRRGRAARDREHHQPGPRHPHRAPPVGYASSRSGADRCPAGSVAPAGSARRPRSRRYARLAALSSPERAAPRARSDPAARSRSRRAGARSSRACRRGPRARASPRRRTAVGFAPRGRPLAEPRRPPRPPRGRAAQRKYSAPSRSQSSRAGGRARCADRRSRPSSAKRWPSTSSSRSTRPSSVRRRARGMRTPPRARRPTSRGATGAAGRVRLRAAAAQPAPTPAARGGRRAAVACGGARGSRVCSTAPSNRLRWIIACTCGRRSRLVGREQRVAGTAVERCGELPREVHRVAEAGRQSLPGERRHRVRGVAEQERAARHANGRRRVRGTCTRPLAGPRRRRDRHAPQAAGGRSPGRSSPPRTRRDAASIRSDARPGSACRRTAARGRSGRCSTAGARAGAGTARSTTSQRSA